ncbi:hypothetical protein EW146_g9766 [Bondarzewia mesenterica]|uniref:Uncharacterized protein n=1 Tax=Bondarzewia mesenterica TaxID=1095465 RepID=A0A4S4L3P6_9AGAM|nr:hypothetical protein EW146_g9766 [Bondarzewia mesenterica]
MPRTKQTTKKSTGGNAPHRSLFGVASATVAVQDAEKEFVRTVAETNSSSVLQKRSSSRVKTLSKTSAAANTPLTAPAVERSGADSLGQQLYSLWCYICHNGGCLMDCSCCSRTVCTMCVQFPEIPNADVIFVCPHCHAQACTKSPQPYLGLYHPDATGARGDPVYPSGLRIVGQPQSSTTSRLSVGPLTVIHFRLKSLDARGNPATIATDLLAPFYPTGTIFIVEDIEFDLNMELNPTSLSVQVKRMVSLAKMLKSSSVDRALIFISTHSNEFTGDLYHEQEGSCTLMDWFMAVVTEPLLRVLSTVDAHWFLLSCGAVVNVPESLQLLKDIISTYNIKNLFAFNAPTFHINLSMTFIIHFVMHVIIEGTPLFDVLGHILADSYHLARHAGILHAYWDGPDLKSRLYCWVHQTARPWGQRLPLQCPGCGSLRSFKVSGKHNLQVRDVVVQCRGKDAAGPGGDWIAMDI